MVNVIFQTAFLGDALLSISLIRHLKKISPNDKVIFVCRPGVGAFFAQQKIADEVIELDKKDSKSIGAFRDRLRGETIRYLLVAHQSPRTTWLLRGIKAEKRISYRQWWNGLFYNSLIERPMYLPEPLRLLALLIPISDGWAARFEEFKTDKKYHNSEEHVSVSMASVPLPSDIDMKVSSEAKTVDRLARSFGLKKPYVAIAPSSQWPTKRWTESGFSKFIELLTARGLNVYLVGSENERAVCEAIAGQSQAGATATNVIPTAVKSLAGHLDLIELHAFLSHAKVVVANDSGSMHMAVVAGRPVVGIFGPTVLSQGYRPWSELSYIVQNELDCRPCGKHGHKQCPLGHHNCMKSISAEQVMKGMEQLSSP